MKNLRKISRKDLKNVLGGLVMDSNKCSCSFYCNGQPRGTVWTTIQDCATRTNGAGWCDGGVKNSMCIGESI
jgi:hypothetical protein